MKFTRTPFFTEHLWWLLLNSHFFIPWWTNNDESYVSPQKWWSSWQRKLSPNTFISSYVKSIWKINFNKINDYLAPYFSDFQTDFPTNHCTNYHLTKIPEIYKYLLDNRYHISVVFGGPVKSLWQTRPFIFYSKVRCVWIVSKIYDGIESYWNKKINKVNANNNPNAREGTCWGVLQRSIFGLLLFNVSEAAFQRCS